MPGTARNLVCRNETAGPSTADELREAKFILRSGRQSGIVPYTVPKLTDYSPAALDKAANELLSALKDESAQAGSDQDYKTFRDRWLARKNGILTLVNDQWLKAAPKDVK